jgi:hypothetical protein
MSNDRRVFDRHEGRGLTCTIGEVTVEVLDLSLGGMKIRRPVGFFQRGQKLEMTLRSADPAEEPTPARGLIRALSHDWLAVQFGWPTVALMRFICLHVGDLMDAPTRTFRRRKGGNVLP